MRRSRRPFTPKMPSECLQQAHVAERACASSLAALQTTVLDHSDRWRLRLSIFRRAVLLVPEAYTSSMANACKPAPKQVGLLVLEEDAHNATALKQILDGEGWRVRVVQDLPMLHAELKTAE